MPAKKTIYLVASGDLRSSANQTCQAAQAKMEQDLTAAIEKEGFKVQRAHPFDKAKGHGFIDSQKYGMEIFSKIPADAPLIVAEAVWQYSHHVLAGLTTHRGPILTPGQLERYVARPRRHAQSQRLAHQGARELQHALERRLHRRLFPQGPARVDQDRQDQARYLAREAAQESERPRRSGQARPRLRQEREA